MNYYTVKEVAAILKVNVATLNRYIREGKIATCRPVGLIRISQAEIDRLMEQ